MRKCKRIPLSGRLTRVRPPVNFPGLVSSANAHICASMPRKPTSAVAKPTRFDPLTPAQRSRQMALVTARNTVPERTVRTVLRSLGYRFGVHAKQLPGTPDIVLGGRKQVILVHGCFWHRHRGCPRTRIPRTRVDFWKRKFQENVARDRANKLNLRRLGWRTLVLWECVTEDPARLRRKLQRFLDGES